MPEPRQFLDTISLFATGVTVITTRDGERVHGMTANAFTSLSLGPMQVIACLGKKAKMAELLQKGTRFTVNLLRDEQEAISNQFAGGKPMGESPEFRFVEWEGGPRIEGGLGAVGCEVGEILEGGDHWIVIGNVLAVQRGIEPLKPLLYFNRRYHRLSPTESTSAPERLDLDTSEPMMFYDPW